MPFVDTTAIQALKQTIENYTERNISFLIANASGQPARIFKQVLGDLLPDKTWDGSFTVSECCAYLKDEEDKKFAISSEGLEDAPTSFLSTKQSKRGSFGGGAADPRPLRKMSQVYSF
eukprot:UN1042